MTGPEPLPPDALERRGLATRAWWWAALLVVAAFSYLYGLDGQYVPRIGDEMPYAQVTRVTAASGQWLPLKADDPFLENTKPRETERGKLSQDLVPERRLQVVHPDLGWRIADRFDFRA